MSNLHQAQLPKGPPIVKGLEFSIAAYGEDCTITYDGQQVAHFTTFDVHCVYGEPTRVKLEGFLANDKPISFSGRLLPDAD